MKLVAAVEISAVVFDVVGRKEPSRNVNVEVKVQLFLSIVSQAVKGRARELSRDVPKLVNGDVFLSVNDAIVILVGVPPVELEELHEFVWEFFSLHLPADVHSPLDELVHGDAAIAVFVCALDQEGESLLLAGAAVIVEFVTWLDSSGASELLDDRLVIVKVDLSNSSRVQIISISEEEFQLLSEEVAHLDAWFFVLGLSESDVFVRKLKIGRAHV